MLTNANIGNTLSTGELHVKYDILIDNNSDFKGYTNFHNHVSFKHLSSFNKTAMFSDNVTISGNTEIGTLNPLYPLDVKGNARLVGDFKVEGDSDFKGNINITDNVTINKNLGIGTSNPLYPLDVKGNTRIVGGLSIFGKSYIEGELRVNDFLRASALDVYDVHSNIIYTGIIYTDNIDAKGIIRASEIRVESIGNFPDYVFKKDYKLRSINEVNQYIQKYGHLPNIPSANEIKENGINIVDMQVKMLEKIEELTLYIIDQQAEIDELKSLINQ